jgi:hypothetical protein
MAHDFLKAEVIGNQALGLLRREVVLPNLVYRDAETHYAGTVGPRNDTVVIPVPGKMGPARELEWRNRNRQIITDDIVEGQASIELDTYLYKAVQLLREEQTLDIADFGRQVLQPMTTSVAETAEDRIALAIQQAPYTEEIEVEATDRGTYNALVDARKYLQQKRIPRAGVVSVLGSEMEARALKDPTFVDASQAGSDSALRDANLGRIAGFNLFSSDAIDPEAIYIFHPTAFPTVFRAPKPARAVPFSASLASDSISLTYWESLDSDNDSDRAFIGTFFGVNHYEDPVDPTDPQGETSFIRAIRLVPANPVGDGTDGGTEE